MTDELKKAQKLIGTKQKFTYNHLSFYVHITDVKSFVGRIQYLIKPVAGTGSDWIETFSKKSKILKNK